MRFVQENWKYLHSSDDKQHNISYNNVVKNTSFHSYLKIKKYKWEES